MGFAGPDCRLGRGSRGRGSGGRGCFWLRGQMQHGGSWGQGLGGRLSLCGGPEPAGGVGPPACDTLCAGRCVSVSSSAEWGPRSLLSPRKCPSTCFGRVGKRHRMSPALLNVGSIDQAALPAHSPAQLCSGRRKDTPFPSAAVSARPSAPGAWSAGQGRCEQLPSGSGQVSRASKETTAQQQQQPGLRPASRPPGVLAPRAPLVLGALERGRGQEGGQQAQPGMRGASVCPAEVRGESPLFPARRPAPAGRGGWRTRQWSPLQAPGFQVCFWLVECYHSATDFSQRLP